MIEVTLYKFGKRPNSTRRPTEDNPHLTVQCILRNPTSIISPVLEIEDTRGDGDLHEYTYAYIPMFNRYYFISNIISVDTLWVYSLRCDVLATFRNTVLDSSQYVVRSASDCDPNIIDTAYITKAQSSNIFRVYTSTQGEDIIFQYDSKEGESRMLDVLDYFHSVINQGCFVIGLLGDNTGGVLYYAMDADAFSDLLTRIFNLVPSNMTDVSSGLANAIYNPMQYLTYCKWFPVMPINRGSSAVTSLAVGSNTVSLTYGHCYQLNTASYEMFATVLVMPTHPAVDAQHAYKNLSPYRKVNFYSGIFGDIPVDTLKMYGTTSLGVVWLVDYTQGRTVLRLYREFNPMATDWQLLFNDRNKMVYETVCDTGVDIPISSLVVDWKVGAALTGLNWLSNSIGNMFPTSAGNIVSGITEGVSSVAEKVKSKYTIHPITGKRAGASFTGTPQPHAAKTYASPYSGGGGGHSFGDSGGGGGHSFDAPLHGGHGRELPAPEIGNDTTDNKNLFDMMADALGSGLGQVVSKGDTASFMSYSILPCVYAWFAYTVDEDNTRNGRPLCQVRVLNTLSGYCLCSNASIAHYEDSIVPMDIEQTTILRLLNTGVFLE